MLISVGKLKSFHGFRSSVFNAFWTDPKASNSFTWFPLFTEIPTMCLLQWIGKATNVLKHYQGTFVSDEAIAKVLFIQRGRGSPLHCGYRAEKENVRSLMAWEVDVGTPRSQGAGSKCLGWSQVGKGNLGCKVPPRALWAWQGWEPSAPQHSARKPRSRKMTGEES